MPAGAGSRRWRPTGIIRARVALLDAARLGLGLEVFIQVKAAAHDAKWLEKFARTTRGTPEIIGVYRMTGDLDYLIRARVADMADYDRLYQTLISRVPMGDVSASFVMEEIKDTTELPPDARRSAMTRLRRLLIALLIAILLPSLGFRGAAMLRESQTVMPRRGPKRGA